MLHLLFMATVFGWDIVGYEAIGMTAMSDLKGKTLAQTKKLLGGKDVVDVAGWARKADTEYKWASQLHFQEQDDNPSCSRTDFKFDCPEKNSMCLIPAIKHFYGHVHGTITTKIAFPDDVTFTDADSMKFLINLLSDMHQPMYLASKEARNIQVKFKGEPMTLFEFWDQRLAKAVMEQNEGFWNGGWTVINAVRGPFEVEKKRFAELKEQGIDTMSKEWATENAQMACNMVGRIRQMPKDGDAYVIDESLFASWRIDMMNRIHMAGARTSILIDSLLHTVDHVLSQGSALHVKNGEAPEALVDEVILTTGNGNPAEKYFANFCINAVLAVFVVTAFYFTVVRDGVTRRVASKYV
eukprot:GEMP01020702.1.p1 GENE.GEMP01020702.1~~GEMP01020702.1.p1  ORF type:complete len:354 (+),score=61.41 GEMP01020702.1:81-1142(+)